MGPTRVNRKLPDECFESGEEQIKGYGKVIKNTEIFSTKYGNNISEVGSPDTGIGMVGNLAVPGKRGRGRPRKIWAECVKTDIRDCGLSAVDPQDRVAWRAAVRLCRVGTTPATGKGVPR